MRLIRLMGQKDVEAVQRIGRRCFTSPWSLEAVQDELSNDLAYYLVAETDGAIAGFIGAWLVAGEVQITNIAVDPDHQRLGIGKQLLSRLIEDMKEKAMHHIFLEVRVSNATAKHLYESLGFEYAGLRKGFYDNKEDAHVMDLSLAGESR